MPALYRGQKSTQTFFVQSCSTTLRVTDVRAENRGRPHQEVCFPAASVVGRNFLTPGHPGVRVRNVRGKSGPKSSYLCCFPSLIVGTKRKISKYLIRKGCLSCALNNTNASPSDGDFLSQTRVSQGAPTVRTNFAPFNCGERRLSLAIFDPNDMKHLSGGLTNHAVLRGAVNIAAAAAENRAIVAHSGQGVGYGLGAHFTSYGTFFTVFVRSVLPLPQQRPALA